MPWHTVTPIADDTYLISEPMGAVAPQYGIETANAYLLLGAERAALVDSAMGIGDLAGVVRSLTTLPCIVLNTHSHWDHSGGNAAFADTAMHQSEAWRLKKGQSMKWLHKRLRTPEAQAVLPLGFDVESYAMPARPVTQMLHDGDEIALGGRTIQALHTPGHSPDHLAYLDESHGLLFTGDIAYRGPVYACFGESDPEAFLTSLQRLAAIVDVGTCCPAHNSVIRDAEWLNEFLRDSEAAIAAPTAGRLTDYPFPARIHEFADSALWLPSEAS